ncbi:universal stress protein [Subsaximicrobium wynnwilliamsii]|uniref:Universal stress protein n=1 Tax=Subsaximicrobium wynnwilliamsii TaxID=291179 RepID=A0A5C6ZN42_9FLAO|nr:universal stress protein [Subsaximicrobium wynnwilliamsii]TXD84419.1 universal stress protein [Subsaximicrobium wynnwilliamsii]TXD90100.1 universal stress protein [Subsaximicrobium wynnwilliamsii]TXE04152.1 universal stress protein [Subsaximicrobium wynnwilliamsii]
MKRKILLPTDFSDNSSQAINYATELYKDVPCVFYLLNVFYIKSKDIESIINMDKGSPMYEASKANSESGLNKLLDHLDPKENGNPNHSFETVTVFNNIVEAIKTVVEEKDIELIVMGNRGETNSRSIVYGNTALDVMEKIRNCPVIVVPQSAKMGLPKEIVFPTSYKTHFKNRELSYLIDIAKKCDASIKVLHISNEDHLTEKQLKSKKLLEDIFKDVNHSFHYLSNMSVPKAINCFVESRESDMVAFINKKHTFFSSILSQPLVKGIAYDSKVPMLVMHDLRN